MMLSMFVYYDQNKYPEYKEPYEMFNMIAQKSKQEPRDLDEAKTTIDNLTSEIKQLRTLLGKRAPSKSVADEH